MQTETTDNQLDEPDRSGRTGRTDAPDAAGKPWGDLQIRRILDALADGATYSDASRAAGVAPRTFRRWRSNHRELREAVQRAEAECATDALEAVQSAARDGKYKAATWLLERRFGYGDSGLDDETVRQFVDVVKSTIREQLDADTAARLITAIGDALEEARDG